MPQRDQRRRKVSARARLESPCASIVLLAKLCVNVAVCDIGHLGEKSNANKLKGLYHQ